MPKPIAVISAKEIISAYKNIVDISSYFRNVESLSLLEDETGLLQWHPTILGDATFYEEVSSAIHPYYPSEKTEYDKAFDLIHHHRYILEIGCGEGHFGTLFKREQWYGVDINKRAINRAVEKGLNCQVWDAFNDSVEDLHCSHPNVICSFQTIEHLANPGCLFEAANRLLSEDGLLLVGAPSHDSILGMAPYSALNLPPHHQTWWTDTALESYPRQYGFE